jgi:hypothetical protein
MGTNYTAMIITTTEAHNTAAGSNPGFSDPSPPAATAATGNPASKINLLVTIGIVAGTLSCVFILFVVLLTLYRREMTRRLASKPDEEVASESLPPPYESCTESTEATTDVSDRKSEKVSLISNEKPIHTYCRLQSLEVYS